MIIDLVLRILLHAEYIWNIYNSENDHATTKSVALI